MKKRIALLAALVGIIGSVATGVAVASQSSQSTAQAQTITVVGTDYHFKITKPAVVKHGVVYKLKFINKGTALHNVDFQHVKATKVIAGGKSQTTTIKFPRKGTYKYVCDVPRHAELGMFGSLKVA
jgi:plastocyanin